MVKALGATTLFPSRFQGVTTPTNTRLPSTKLLVEKAIAGVASRNTYRVKPTTTCKNVSTKNSNSSSHNYHNNKNPPSNKNTTSKASSTGILHYFFETTLEIIESHSRISSSIFVYKSLITISVFQIMGYLMPIGASDYVLEDKFRMVAKFSEISTGTYLIFIQMQDSLMIFTFACFQMFAYFTIIYMLLLAYMKKNHSQSAAFLATEKLRSRVNAVLNVWYLTFLFALSIPSLEVNAGIVVCGKYGFLHAYNDNCDSKPSVFIVLGVIGYLIFQFGILILQYLFRNYEFCESNPLKRRFNVAMVGMALCRWFIVFNFFTNLFSHNATYMFLELLAGISIYDAFVNRPYANMQLDRYNAVVSISFAIYVSTFIFGEIIHFREMDFEMFYFMLVAIAIVYGFTAAIFAEFKYQILTLTTPLTFKRLSRYLDRCLEMIFELGLNQGIDVNDRVQLNQLLKYHRMSCVDVACSCSHSCYISAKDTIDIDELHALIDRMFLWGLQHPLITQNQPDFEHLSLKFVTYLVKYRNNSFRAYYELKCILSRNSHSQSFYFRALAMILTRKIENDMSALEKCDQTPVRVQLRSILKADQIGDEFIPKFAQYLVAKQAYYEFLRQADAQKTTIESFSILVHSIAKQGLLIKQAYFKAINDPAFYLLKKSYQMIKVMQLFNIIVSNDVQAAAKHELELMELMRSDKNKRCVGISNEDVVEGNLLTLQISLARNKGEIIGCNSRAVAVYFGFEVNHVVSEQLQESLSSSVKHINKMMPQPLASIHNAIIENYIARGGLSEYTLEQEEQPFLETNISTNQQTKHEKQKQKQKQTIKGQENYKKEKRTGVAVPNQNVPAAITNTFSNAMGAAAFKSEINAKINSFAIDANSFIFPIHLHISPNFVLENDATLCGTLVKQNTSNAYCIFDSLGRIIGVSASFFNHIFRSVHAQDELLSSISPQLLYSEFSIFSLFPSLSKLLSWKSNQIIGVTETPASSKEIIPSTQLRNSMNQTPATGTTIGSASKSFSRVRNSVVVGRTKKATANTTTTVTTGAGMKGVSKRQVNICSRTSARLIVSRHNMWIMDQIEEILNGIEVSQLHQQQQQDVTKGGGISSSSRSLRSKSKSEFPSDDTLIDIAVYYRNLEGFLSKHKRELKQSENVLRSLSVVFNLSYSEYSVTQGTSNAPTKHSFYVMELTELNEKATSSTTTGMTRHQLFSKNNYNTRNNYNSNSNQVLNVLDDFGFSAKKQPANSGSAQTFFATTTLDENLLKSSSIITNSNSLAAAGGSCSRENSKASHNNPSQNKESYIDNYEISDRIEDNKVNQSYQSSTEGVTSSRGGPEQYPSLKSSNSQPKQQQQQQKQFLFLNVGGGNTADDTRGTISSPKNLLSDSDLIARNGLGIGSTSPMHSPMGSQLVNDSMFSLISSPSARLHGLHQNNGETNLPIVMRSSRWKKRASSRIEMQAFHLKQKNVQFQVDPSNNPPFSSSSQMQQPVLVAYDDHNSIERIRSNQAGVSESFVDESQVGVNKQDKGYVDESMRGKIVVKSSNMIPGDSKSRGRREEEFEYAKVVDKKKKKDSGKFSLSQLLKQSSNNRWVNIVIERTKSHAVTRSIVNVSIFGVIMLVCLLGLYAQFIKNGLQEMNNRLENKVSATTISQEFAKLSMMGMLLFEGYLGANSLMAEPENLSFIQSQLSNSLSIYLDNFNRFIPPILAESDILFESITFENSFRSNLIAQTQSDFEFLFVALTSAVSMYDESSVNVNSIDVDRLQFMFSNFLRFIRLEYKMDDYVDEQTSLRSDAMHASNTILASSMLTVILFLPLVFLAIVLEFTKFQEKVLRMNSRTTPLECANAIASLEVLLSAINSASNSTWLLESMTTLAYSSSSSEEFTVDPENLHVQPSPLPIERVKVVKQEQQSAFSNDISPRNHLSERARTRSESTQIFAAATTHSHTLKHSSNTYKNSNNNTNNFNQNRNVTKQQLQLLQRKQMVYSQYVQQQLPKLKLIFLIFLAFTAIFCFFASMNYEVYFYLISFDSPQTTFDTTSHAIESVYQMNAIAESFSSSRAIRAAVGTTGFASFVSGELVDFMDSKVKRLEKYNRQFLETIEGIETISIQKAAQIRNTFERDLCSEHPDDCARSQSIRDLYSRGVSGVLNDYLKFFEGNLQYSANFLSEDDYQAFISSYHTSEKYKTLAIDCFSNVYSVLNYFRLQIIYLCLDYTLNLKDSLLWCVTVIGTCLILASVVLALVFRAFAINRLNIFAFALTLIPHAKQHEEATQQLVKALFKP